MDYVYAYNGDTNYKYSIIDIILTVENDIK